MPTQLPPPPSGPIASPVPTNASVNVQYPRARERHAKEESGQDRHRGRVQIYE